MYNEITRYKFSQPLEDLTRTQMHYLTVCAMEHQRQIDEAMGRTNDYSNPSTDRAPSIKDTDSTDVQKAKIAAIKAQLRGQPQHVYK